MKIFVLLALLVFSGCTQYRGTEREAQIVSKLNAQSEVKTVAMPEIWLEIHDVSPGWEYWRLEQLINVTEKHRGIISKAVLFVIPNHANATPLRAYPDYVAKLSDLSEQGYILGMHGYAHPTYPNFEMNISKDNARALIRAGLGEFEEVGLGIPRYFAPPGFVVSSDAASYIDDSFDYVYYANATKTPEGRKGYASHEYTWYTTDVRTALENAKKDYLQTSDVFRLTLHLEAANNPEGLAFLDEFLEWVNLTSA